MYPKDNEQKQCLITRTLVKSLENWILAVDLPLLAR